MKPLCYFGSLNKFLKQIFCAMKKILLSFGAAFTMLAASAQVKLLVVHNCADPAADTVDVYVKNAALPGGEQKIIDNFPFRSAYYYDPGFPAIPSSTDVVIAPKGSTSSAQGIYTKNFPSGIAAGNYVIVANGLVDTNYISAANPSGVPKAFDLDVISGVSFTSSNPNQAALTIHHGVVDAPAVTVQAFITTIQTAKRDTAVDNAPFRATTASFQYPAEPRRLHVYATGSNTPAYQANGDALKLLGGAASFVFASGFLAPPTGGANFGLFAAVVAPNQANGYVTVAELPKEKVAGVVQVYHNAADPAVKNVDLYVGGIKQQLGLTFRAGFQSAGFIQDFDYVIDLHQKDSAASVLNTTLRFDSDSVVAVVSGVLDTTKFTANPDGVSRKLGFFLNKPSRITAAAGSTQVTLFHGATDAPTVSLTAPGFGGLELISATKYGQFNLAAPTGIGSALPTNLGTVVVDVKLPNNATYKSYLVPLPALDGKAVTVCASGFVDSASNQNGAAFKVFAGLPSAPFPQIVFLRDTSLTTSITNPATADMSFRMFPNPATSELIVGFDVKEESNVSIDILDLSGKVVKSVLNDTFATGTVYHTENVRDLTNGLYFARVKSGNATSTYKFNVVR